MHTHAYTLQAYGNLDEVTRKSATGKYLRRVRSDPRNQYVRFTNQTWSQEEIDTTNVKTRKLLTMHGGGLVECQSHYRLDKQPDIVVVDRSRKQQL